MIFLINNPYFLIRSDFIQDSSDEQFSPIKRTYNLTPPQN